MSTKSKEFREDWMDPHLFLKNWAKPLLSQPILFLSRDLPRKNPEFLMTASCVSSISQLLFLFFIFILFFILKVIVSAAIFSSEDCVPLFASLTTVLYVAINYYYYYLDHDNGAIGVNEKVQRNWVMGHTFHLHYFLFFSYFIHRKSML